MTLPIHGACLCKKIQYRINAMPKAVGCCYCKTCQIKSGSDHIVYLACEIETVSIEGSVKWYSSIGSSGLPKQHGFCAECGSTLFGMPEHWPHLIIVYAGSLFDSSSYIPQTNLWIKEAPKWSCIDKSLKTFVGNPS